MSARSSARWSYKDPMATRPRARGCSRCSRWSSHSSSTTGAWLALLRGGLGSAETLAGEAIQIGADAGQSDAYMLYGGQLQEIRLYQGRGGELIELLEQGVAANPGIPAWRAALAQTLGWI